MSIDKFQNTVVDISSSKHDRSSRVKCLDSQTGAQVSLQRPLDRVLRVTFPGKWHRIYFCAFSVDASRDVDITQRAGEVLRAVAAVALDGRVWRAPHEGWTRLSRAFVQNCFAPIAREAFLANADCLMSVARWDETVNVCGYECATVFHDNNVFAFAAAGLTPFLFAFVLLLKLNFIIIK